jgi:hypothetical protein
MNPFRRPAFLTVLALAVCALAPAAFAQQEPPSEPPLPDARAFLDEVRRHIHTDDYLLDQYTFIERRTEQQFDKKGRVKEEKREVYEVYPSARPRHTYRKLVERDGRPISAEELAEQDREHEKKVARASRDGAAEEEKRRKRAAERQRREQEVVDEIFRAYDVTLMAREVIEGRSAIVVDFRPRPGFKPSNRIGKILHKFTGRAWVDEEDYQVVRAEAQLIDTFSYGLGVLARLYEGATASFLRRKVNGEVWLPAEARFRGHARLLLLKGIRVDSRSEYSDYKKFEVATDSAITAEEMSK